MMGSMFSYYAPGGGGPAVAENPDFSGPGDRVASSPPRRSSSGDGEGLSPPVAPKANQVAAKVVLDRNWEARFNLLVEYKQQHGDVRVHPSYKVSLHPPKKTTIRPPHYRSPEKQESPKPSTGGDVVRLGKWLENQKSAFSRNKLPLHRYEKLRSIGVTFGKKGEDADLALEDETPAKARARGRAKSTSPKIDNRWDRRMQLLIEYKQANGDVRVPPGHAVDGIALGKWLENQKTAYKRDKLRPDRHERLRSAGVAFGTKATTEAAAAPNATPTKATTRPRAKSLSPKVDNQWEAMRRRLVAYGAVHGGNCNVPSTYADDPSLAKWVENQRMFYHKGRLADDRVQSLKDVGFDFGAPKVDRWQFHLEELKAYREKWGHCDVPQSYDVGGIKLGKWVNRQRTRGKAGRMPKEEVERLGELEFWD